MRLLLAKELDIVKKKYIEVIDNTPEMKIHTDGYMDCILRTRCCSHTSIIMKCIF